eukprot:TRINITY_DN1498_c0_g1_i2.p1 TRINITY_DN1498_c0_g1~~TRINITY_DN1498_c0_g1_i2.p1  ORF type:complete len:765 (+),score=153.08 TRINITY_DN1498_c0_g1_i2:814-3108(+)
MEDGLAEVQSTVTNGLINYFREYNSACRNGTKLWSDLEPACKKYFADRISGKKSDSKDDIKSPAERPLTASANNVLSAVMGSPSPVASVVPVLGASQPPEIEKQVKQGYLWVKNKKKGGGWKKRWVSVINGRLLYYKNWKTNVPKETFNLVTCSAKRWEDSSRPFGFELQSADMRNLVFCANDERDLQHWLDVINGIITSLFNSMNSGEASAAKSQAEENNAYAELMEIKGNETCADCGRADPDWAVMNHGITICIECSGVHRSLGVHISKVRSLKLDVWEPELLLMMKSIGNVKSNASVYEAALTEKERIPPNADRARREAFIKAKYMDKKWVPPVSSASAIVSLLLKKKRFVPVVSILKLICQGADPNWQDPQDGVSLLHRCAADDNVTAVEFLFTIGAKLDIQDKLGLTPLHYAAKDDAAAAIRLLLTHGASTEIKDQQGKTPLQLAREADSVDAISLLDYQEDSSLDVTTPRGVSTPDVLPTRRTSKFNLSVGSPSIRVSGDSDAIGMGSPRGMSTASMLSPREKARARRTMTFAEDAKAREDFLKALEEEGAAASPPIVKSPSGETLASRLDSSAVTTPRTPRGSSRTSNSESQATEAQSPLLRNLSGVESSRRRGVSESVGRHASASSSSKDKDRERDKDKDKSRGKSSSASSSRDRDRERDKDKDKDKDRERDKDKERHRSRKDSDKDKPRHHERQSSNTSTRSSSSLSNSNDGIDSARGERPDSARGEKSESSRDRASSIRISTSSATQDTTSTTE